MTNKTIDALGLVAALGALVAAIGAMMSLARCTQPEVPKAEPSCAGACVQLERLNCEEAQPSPGGIPCEGWCSHYHGVGYLRPWAECVAGSTDVDGVRACGLECRQ